MVIFKRNFFVVKFFFGRNWSGAFLLLFTFSFFFFKFCMDKQINVYIMESKFSVLFVEGGCFFLRVQK